MIIAGGSNKITDKQVLIFGFSRENINRLMAGQPIKVTTETHGQGIPINAEFIFMFGETEITIARELQKIGTISDETKITAMPDNAE